MPGDEEEQLHPGKQTLSRTKKASATLIVGLVITSGLHKSSQFSGDDLSSRLLLPILFQHQLVYLVGVMHLMDQQVPEHYMHRVMTECLMLARPLPIVCG